MYHHLCRGSCVLLFCSEGEKNPTHYKCAYASTDISPHFPLSRFLSLSIFLFSLHVLKKIYIDLHIYLLLWQFSSLYPSIFYPFPLPFSLFCHLSLFSISLTLFPSCFRLMLYLLRIFLTRIKSADSSWYVSSVLQSYSASSAGRLEDGLKRWFFDKCVWRTFWYLQVVFSLEMAGLLASPSIIPIWVWIPPLKASMPFISSCSIESAGRDLMQDPCREIFEREF